MGRDRDEPELPFLRLWALRLSILLIAFVTRLCDLLVLLFRPRLLRPYLVLWWAELLASPYQAHRSFESVRSLRATGQAPDELMYGEMPVFSGLLGLRRAGVDRTSRVLDLGAGRGRLLLAARWLGAQARGIELQRAHVQPLQRALQRVGASLELGDVLSAELGEPTHVFLNWCALTPETRQRLLGRVGALAAGTRVVAVSVAPRHPRLVLIGKTFALLSWGIEPVFVHEVRG